jgi:hypothetical protein
MEGDCWQTSKLGVSSGVLAQMFHERRIALRKMVRLRPPMPAASLDYSLWLARRPPEGLQHDRAAFIWWTGVHYKMRRWVHPSSM